MTFMPSLQRRPKEAAAIGRLLTGYGELEFELALLVAAVLGNADQAFKALFRTRGEEARSEIADALVRNLIPEGEERAFYDATLKALGRCRRLRNRYAHSHWLEAGGELRFVEVERAAREPDPLDLATVEQRPLSLRVLLAQEADFAHVRDRLAYLNFQAQVRRGRIPLNPRQKPEDRPLPPEFG